MSSYAIPEEELYRRIEAIPDEHLRELVSTQWSTIRKAEQVMDVMARAMRHPDSVDDCMPVEVKKIASVCASDDTAQKSYAALADLLEDGLSDYLWGDFVSFFEFLEYSTGTKEGGLGAYTEKIFNEWNSLQR